MQTAPQFDTAILKRYRGLARTSGALRNALAITILVERYFQRSGENFLLTGADIAVDLGLTPQQADAALQILEDAGAITRPVDPRDTRYRLVRPVPGAMAPATVHALRHAEAQAPMRLEGEAPQGNVVAFPSRRRPSSQPEFQLA